MLNLPNPEEDLQLQQTFYRGFEDGLGLQLASSDYRSSFRQNGRQGLVLPNIYLNNFFAEKKEIADANCVEKSLNNLHLLRAQGIFLLLNCNTAGSFHVYPSAVLDDLVYEMHVSRIRKIYLLRPDQNQTLEN
jgi:hypothetical protein